MYSGGKPQANERDRNGGRLELCPLVRSPDGELEVSISRPRVSLLFTVERGRVCSVQDVSGWDACGRPAHLEEISRPR